MINELIKMINETHRHRKQTYGYQRGRGGGINEEFGVDVYTLLYIYKIDKQQGSTVEHREL